MANPLDTSVDYKIFDNTEVLDIVHRDGDANINYSNDTVQQHQLVFRTDYCLVRQMSNRVAGIVRQIFQRGMAISNDKFNLVDTLIEIPTKEYRGKEVAIDDEIIQYSDAPHFLNVKRRYMVLAVDSATFNTRIRAACRSL